MFFYNLKSFLHAITDKTIEFPITTSELFWFLNINQLKLLRLNGLKCQKNNLRMIFAH